MKYEVLLKTDGILIFVNIQISLETYMVNMFVMLD